MSDSIEVDVKTDPHATRRFIWVLRVTKPIVPLFRSVDNFGTRVDAIKDWDNKKDAFIKAWELMRDE